MRAFILVVVLVLLPAPPSFAQQAEKFPIPLTDPITHASIQLEAVLYRPQGPGPFPLVVINHGSPGDQASAANQSSRYRSQSRWFVSHGFAVIAPSRRGYGDSGGSFAESNGSCQFPDFLRSGNAAAFDILTTARYMQAQPFIDKARLLLVGVSAGGWGSLAAAAQHPEGLLAVISFSGGQGSFGNGRNCAPHLLVAAARDFGREVNVPTLWVWSENDTWFSPDLAPQMFSAFDEPHSSKNSFVMLPAFETEGHPFSERQKEKLRGTT